MLVVAFVIDEHFGPPQGFEVIVGPDVFGRHFQQQICQFLIRIGGFDKCLLGGLGQFFSHDVSLLDNRFEFLADLGLLGIVPLGVVFSQLLKIRQQTFPVGKCFVVSLALGAGWCSHGLGSRGLGKGHARTEDGQQNNRK